MSTLDTPWRRLATLFFGSPSDPVITTTYEIDAAAVLNYCAESRRPGVSLRPIHFVAVAAARTVAQDVPELNGYVKRGRIVPKRDVSLLITALLPGGNDLIQLHIPNADRLDAAGMASQMRNEVQRHRARSRKGEAPPEYLLARLPWMIRKGVYGTLHALTHRLGLRLARLDLAPESLGSLILSDLSRFTEHIDPGHALVRNHHGPLMPAGHAAAYLALSSPRAIPTVHDGEIVSRMRIPLCGTFDHRVVDGSHVGRFFDGMIRRLQDPESLDQPMNA